MDANETLLSVRVSTRKSKVAIKDLSFDGLVRIDLTSAPIEGKANLELIKFLASLLKIHNNEIVIRSGVSSRNKLVQIKGIDRETVIAQLRNKID